MKPYVINQDRLQLELDHNAKAKAKGVLNWFITEEYGFKVYNVYYDIYGVRYICRVTKEDLYENVKTYLDNRSKIQGLYEEPEQEEEFTMPEMIYNEDT